MKSSQGQMFGTHHFITANLENRVQALVRRTETRPLQMTITICSFGESLLLCHNSPFLSSNRRVILEAGDPMDWHAETSVTRYRKQNIRFK